MDKKKGKLNWKMVRPVLGILLAAAVVCDTLPVGSFAVSAAGNRKAGYSRMEVLAAALPNPGTGDNAEKPQAQVEKDGEISYVADFFDAFAKENTGATVTLLEDVNLGGFSLGISEGTDFTLDLNGKTITGTSSLISVRKGARLTIQDSDSGQLISPWYCVSVDGELALEGGSFFSSKTDGDSAGVRMFSKDASIAVTGPVVKIDSLVISSGKDISLIAGTYGRIVTDSSHPLASLLGEGHAYYRDGGPIFLADLENKTELAGPVTVKKCGHDGVKPASNGGGTHTLDCPYCSYAGEERCAVSQDGPVLYTGEGEKEPACTEEGLGHRECVCGAVAESGVRVKALGHTGGKASCSRPAVCTRCGQPYGGTDKGSHGNTQVRGYVAQTCTAGGYTGDTYCTDCGAAVETGSATPALSHAWQVLREEAATVLAEGKRFYTCVRCAQTREESIPRLPASDPGNISKEDMEKNSAKLDAGISVKWKGNAIALKWAKVAGADGYDIFAAQSGKKLNRKSPDKTVKSGKTSVSITKAAGKKISGKNVYCVQIEAWKHVDGKKVSMGVSRAFYTAGKKNKTYTNAKELKPAKKKYTLKKGKSLSLPVTVAKESKKKKLLPKSYGPVLRYKSSDEKVATVTSKGRVKAKRRGTCDISVTALNGVRTKIKITVK